MFDEIFLFLRQDNEHVRKKKPQAEQDDSDLDQICYNKIKINEDPEVKFIKCNN